MVTPRPDPLDDDLLAMLSAIGANRPGWHRDAACKGSDLDFTDIRNPTTVRACLSLCGICDVRVDCLRFAVEVEDASAILGGCDPSARRPLIRERRRQLEQQAEGETP